MTSLAELYTTNAQSYAVLANLRDLGHATRLSFELGQIAGTAEWTLYNWLSTETKETYNSILQEENFWTGGGGGENVPVDRSVTSGADVERVVLVVLQLMRITRILLTHRQDLTRCCRHFRSWTELEKSTRERSCRLVVLEFEEEVECCAQSQDEMNWLQVAVCEVRGHL